MPSALYRKYRPQSFSELVGQNHIKVTLENEVESSRVAHAYLFSGPRGIGKTTTARLLAKAVNCEKRKGVNPCNKCVFCQEITEGRSMDLIEIDAASHTGVDNVRENIIENSRFTPLRTKYKVFIIDEVHMLSISAFNALLKTLEEPPEHAIFILATTEIYRVPETIISRCQRFDFKKVNVNDLVKRLQYILQLEKVNVDKEILKNIAVRAEGSVRDAEVLLAQILALGEKDITKEEAELVIPRSDIKLIIELVNYLITSNMAAAISLINKLIEEGVNVTEFTKDLIEFLRKMLLVKIGGQLDEYSTLELGDENTRKMESFSQNLKIQEIVRLIEIFLEKYKEIKYAQIPQLPLELAVIEICQARTEEIPSQNIEPTEVEKKKVLNKENTLTKGKESSKKQENKPKSANQITLSKVQKKWPEILAKLRSHNHSLALSCKVCIPVQIEGDSLTIGFKFKLHQERIKDRKNLVIIEDVVRDVLGEKLSIKPIVVSEAEYGQLSKFVSLVNHEEDDVANQVLETFGGRFVNE